MKSTLSALLIAITCAGCAVKTASRIPAPDHTTIEPHDMRVCLLTGPLPETLEGRQIGKIVASKLVYGGRSRAHEANGRRSTKDGCRRCDKCHNKTTNRRSGLASSNRRRRHQSNSPTDQRSTASKRAGSGSSKSQELVPQKWLATVSRFCS